jgi:hypothetical protein
MKEERFMDIKVLNLDKNKLLQFNNMSDKDKDKYLTQSLYPGLGLRVIVQDYQLTDDINDKIDYLCLDESYRLVIVEKRFGKIVGKYVLYRGENITVDGIKYLNVEQFLCE